MAVKVDWGQLIGGLAGVAGAAGVIKPEVSAAIGQAASAFSIEGSGGFTTVPIGSSHPPVASSSQPAAAIPAGSGVAILALLVFGGVIYLALR